MKIILGSASSHRRRLLEEAGYSFNVMTADINEKAIRSDDYYELPLLLARAKSKALIRKLSANSVLITSDLIVICNGELREKPDSKKQAREFLRSYGEYPAETVNAVVVYNSRTKKTQEAVDRAVVYFRQIPESVIDSVVKEGLVLNAAGGFMVEHPILSRYLLRIEGDRDSVIGMPVKILSRLMKESF